MMAPHRDHLLWLLDHVDDPANPDRWSHPMHIAARAGRGITTRLLEAYLQAMESDGHVMRNSPKLGDPTMWRRRLPDEQQG